MSIEGGVYVLVCVCGHCNHSAYSLLCSNKLDRGVLMKCLICQQRPRLEESRYCGACNDLVKSNVTTKRRPERYVVYKEYVVGMFKNGNGKLHPEMVKVAVGSLPKRNVLNLNEYIEGFDRAQVKELKRTVLQCCELKVDMPKGNGKNKQKRG